MTLPALLVISDRKQARRSLAEIAERIFAAGCRWLSLREKDLSADEQMALARTLLPIARSHGARLTLHGDAAVANAAGLDGVHLPAGADARQNRAIIGAGRSLGLSIHTADEASAIDPTVVDYGVAGPVFATASKPGYGPALGPAGLARIVAVSTVPIFAIGGITPSNAGGVAAAGIAVMGSIMRADDPGAEVAALLAARLSQRPR